MGTLSDNKYHDNQMGAALSVVEGSLSLNLTWFKDCRLIGTPGSNSSLYGGSALYFNYNGNANNKLTILDSHFYNCTVDFEYNT